MVKQTLLELAEEIESSGIGLFRRTGNDLTIWVRMTAPDSEGQWDNAMHIARAIGGKRTTWPEQVASGHLVVTVRDVFDPPKLTLKQKLRAWAATILPLTGIASVVIGIHGLATDNSAQALLLFTTSWLCIVDLREPNGVGIDAKTAGLALNRLRA